MRAAKRQFEEEQQEKASEQAEFSGADGAVSADQTDGEEQDVEMQDS